MTARDIGHNSAGGQLRAFVERILRLKEEQQSIAGDIREVYAEAKSIGFDKTALGQIVAYVSKRDKDSAKFEEQSAIFDLYLKAYEEALQEQPSHVHTRAREDETPPTPQSEQAAEDFEPPAFLVKKEPLRPHCLNPDLCAGSGRQHCHRCTKAMAESEAA